MSKCLVCFAPLDPGYPSEYHKKCAKALFETTTAPAIDLDLNTLAEAGLSLLRSSGAVPGVQKKLSVDRNPEQSRRMMLRALGGRYILKNFSLYCPSADLWQLTPAYDLVSTALVIPEDKDEIALTANGKKSRLTQGDWLLLAGKLGVVPRVFDNLTRRLRGAWPDVETLCRASFLPTEQQDVFLARWQERVGRLPEGNMR